MTVDIINTDTGEVIEESVPRETAELAVKVAVEDGKPWAVNESEDHTQQAIDIEAEVISAAESAVEESAGRPMVVTNENKVMIPPEQAVAALGAAGLIQHAISTLADPSGTIETLYKMHREERAEEQRQAWGQAMREFQSACPPIPKTKAALDDKKQVMYYFAPMEVAANHARSYLEACGLSYTQDVSLDGKRVVVTTIVRHVAGHSERTNFESDLVAGTRRMSVSQVVAATVTFCRRQGFFLAFGMSTIGEDDLDGGQRGHGEPEPKQEATDGTGAKVSQAHAMLCEDAALCFQGMVPTGWGFEKVDTGMFKGKDMCWLHALDFHSWPEQMKPKEINDDVIKRCDDGATTMRAQFHKWIGAQANENGPRWSDWKPWAVKAKAMLNLNEFYRTEGGKK